MGVVYEPGHQRAGENPVVEGVFGEVEEGHSGTGEFVDEGSFELAFQEVEEGEGEDC